VIDGVAVKVPVLFKQIVVELDETVGGITTETVLLVVALQPAAVVTVTSYVVFEAGLTVIGFTVWVVLHKYVAPPVAVNVAVPPAQIEALLTPATGKGLTVTVPDAVALQPFVVAVTE
jgi:hypothetical protein